MKLLTPLEMLQKFTKYPHGVGPTRGWAVRCLPDGSAFTQYTPVYKTKHEALRMATANYVSFRARHDLGWDRAIDESFRSQFDAVFWTVHEAAVDAILDRVERELPGVFRLHVDAYAYARSLVRPLSPDWSTAYVCRQLVRNLKLDLPFYRTA